MADQPLVSIILPTYNRAGFLSKAISSVLAQTFTDWELIIWNDGSGDGTEQVVFSFKDSRIKYFYEENHGKCYALNRAIERSKGQWIALLDDDDQWLSSKLATQWGVVSRYPGIDLLFTNFRNINLDIGNQANGFDQLKEAMGKLIVEKLDRGVYQIKDKFPEGISTANFILPSSIIIKKSALIKTGEFNENLRNAEDVEFWWRLFLHGYAFAYVNKILVDRIKPKGSLSSASLATYKNIIKSMDTIHSQILKYGRRDLVPYLRNAYKRAWLGMAREHAIKGERKKAWQAINESRKYGLNRKDVILLSKSIASVRIRNLMTK